MLSPSRQRQSTYTRSSLVLGNARVSTSASPTKGLTRTSVAQRRPTTVRFSSNPEPAQLRSPLVTTPMRSSLKQSTFISDAQNRRRETGEQRRRDHMERERPPLLSFNSVNRNESTPTTKPIVVLHPAPGKYENDITFYAIYDLSNVQDDARRRFSQIEEAETVRTSIGSNGNTTYRTNSFCEDFVACALRTNLSTMEKREMSKIVVRDCLFNILYPYLGTKDAVRVRVRQHAEHPTWVIFEGCIAVRLRMKPSRESRRNSVAQRNVKIVQEEYVVRKEVSAVLTRVLSNGSFYSRLIEPYLTNTEVCDLSWCYNQGEGIDRENQLGRADELGVIRVAYVNERCIAGYPHPPQSFGAIHRHYRSPPREELIDNRSSRVVSPKSSFDSPQRLFSEEPDPRGQYRQVPPTRQTSAQLGGRGSARGPSSQPFMQRRHVRSPTIHVRNDDSVRSPLVTHENHYHHHDHYYYYTDPAIQSPNRRLFSPYVPIAYRRIQSPKQLIRFHSEDGEEDLMVRGRDQISPVPYNREGYADHVRSPSPFAPPPLVPSRVAEMYKGGGVYRPNPRNNPSNLSKPENDYYPVHKPAQPLATYESSQDSDPLYTNPHSEENGYTQHPKPQQAQPPLLPSPPRRPPPSSSSSSSKAPPVVVIKKSKSVSLPPRSVSFESSDVDMTERMAGTWTVPPRDWTDKLDEGDSDSYRNSHRNGTVESVTATETSVETVDMGTIQHTHRPSDGASRGFEDDIPRQNRYGYPGFRGTVSSPRRSTQGNNPYTQRSINTSHNNNNNVNNNNTSGVSNSSSSPYYGSTVRQPMYFSC